MQNSTGGFGGGHGQISHLAGSYAAVLSLAMVGGEEAFALVDRQAMLVVSLSLRGFGACV
jgi:protein farnesyltransferase subunit beta